MSPLTSRVNRVIKVACRDAASDDGKSCSNNAWSCLNTAGQFGVIFSIIIVVMTIAWVYWYTVIRPRQERIRESGEDIELDLGDGRTVVVSSGPYQRTVVFRRARSPTPPPPAYRPPTPGAGVIVPPGFATTTDSLPPSPRASHTQIWPPQAPPQRPQTPQNAPPQSMILIPPPPPPPPPRPSQPPDGGIYRQPTGTDSQVTHPPLKTMTLIEAAHYLQRAAKNEAHHGVGARQQVVRNSHVAAHRPPVNEDANMLAAVQPRAPAAPRHEDDSRGEEAERLQKLVDRIDKEEEEEREHRGAHGEASGIDKLPRLPGQPLRTAVPRAETGNAVAETSVQQQDPQRRQEGNEAYEIDNEESQTNRPKRHVTFQQPSLEVLESRIGRPSRRSQSPARIPNQEDLHHGESRVGRRRRTPSPDERIVERPVAPVLSSAESRIGRPQPPSPPKEHSLVHKRSHGFPGAGESRVGHHHGRKRRLTHPPETISPGAGSDYYNTHDTTHGGHPTIDDGFLLSIARSEGPPSSAGATCGTRSHASSESNDRRRRMGLTPSRFNRDRDQRADEGATPYLRSPSPEESDNDEQKKLSPKPSWGSRLASILPTIARLTTNNPVVREVADDIADEREEKELREDGRLEVRADSPLATGHKTTSKAFIAFSRLSAFQDPASGTTLVAHAPKALVMGHHGCQGEEPNTKVPSRDQYRGHRRRPSTIAEEPRNSLQLTLEHAAERLAEEAVGSDMDRARDPGGGLGGHADAMPGQHDQRRRRPRRSSRATES
ncbi:hypothetical protein N8I77_007399 [Diaporthe amygdali]|uniref:Uncharacterized protein n=1 Tax=Phomopsis amygdali TaxID=1214568 RepID=A0AAD9SBY0_PHOAM|nr:hypothetical protein N8I77_007399 [Diaporthe amygdali]